MKNMHVILTDKPSRLFIYNGNLGLAKDFQYGSNSIQNQNIYITSDEEIKEGDAYITKNGEICKSHNGSKILLFKTDKKIILTTDPRLAPDVQKIDDDFLEWFVKNQSCEEIEINQEFNPKNMVYGINTNPYKIIIPKEEQKDINAHTGFDDDGNSLNYQGNMLPLKEEPKQELVGYRLKPSIDRIMVDGILKNAMPVWKEEDKSVYFIKGHVAGSLVAKMKKLQVLDLWFTPIYENEEVKSDWIKQNHLDYYYKEGIMSDKSKPETLEEAAERLKNKELFKESNRRAKEFLSKIKNKEALEEASIKYIGFSESLDKNKFEIEYYNRLLDEQNAFKEGAKWKAEQDKNKFSIEEVVSIVKKSLMYCRSVSNIGIDKWVEQFKKK